MRYKSVPNIVYLFEKNCSNETIPISSWMFLKFRKVFFSNRCFSSLYGNKIVRFLSCQEFLPIFSSFLTSQVKLHPSCLTCWEIFTHTFERARSLQKKHKNKTFLSSKVHRTKIRIIGFKTNLFKFVLILL